MAFTDAEVLWATQVLLSRFTHQRSYLATEDLIRIFGTIQERTFSFKNVGGVKHIFSCYVDDGDVIIDSIPMFFIESNPSYDATKWVRETKLEVSATKACIEYDGLWIKNEDSGKYECETEDTAWIFYVASGTLYAKYGDEDAVALSTNVTEVSAARGWLHADKDPTSDMGLIVGYIKTDGLVYYRNYCYQEDGSQLWEVEANVTEFTSTCTDLKVFRTNDFRVGFAVRVAGELNWALTERNYSGMSIADHSLTVGISEITFVVTGITYKDGWLPDEYLLATVVPEIIPRYTGTDNVFKSASNDGETTVNAKTAYFLTELTGSDFLVVDEDDTEFAVTDVQYGETWQHLVLTVNDLSYSAEGSDLTLKFIGSGTTKGSNGQDVDAFEFTFTPTGITYEIPDPPVVEAIWNE